MCFCEIALSQSTFNNNVFLNGRYLGWDFSNGANPLFIKTNNQVRMQINGITTAFGDNTSGFIGIGTYNPAAPIHIVGAGQQNAMGWRRGLTLSNSAALVWDGGPQKGFFIAHPSSTPQGNLYAGIGNDLNAGSAVDYVYSIHVNSQIGNNPIGTTQFYKNVLVYDNTTERKMGINQLNPTRTCEIYDGGGTITDAQLRLSGPNGNYTDFRTTNAGAMLITPVSGKLGITSGGNSIYPGATLDVDGDLRVRNVSTGAPDALIIGSSNSQSSDVTLKRMDFSGNANEVLLGDGTWGTLPPNQNTSANNGCSIAGTNIQLGELYNATQSAPLLNNREIAMKTRNIVFTGTGRIGMGLSFPDLPTQKLDVKGNARLRDLPLIANQSNSIQNKIVMVDSLGNFKWMELSSLNSLSNASNGASVINGNIEWGTNPLTHDTEIPMNGKNISFSCVPNTPSNTNNVKIGGDNTPLPVKLSVVNDNESIGSLVMSTSPTYNNASRIGLMAQSQNANNTIAVGAKAIQGANVKGVYATGENGTTITVGVQGSASTNTGLGNVFGGHFTAGGNSVESHVGVNGSANGSPKTNIGGYFMGNEGTTAIGVYGEASSGTPGASVYAGYFAGPVIQGAPSVPSDIQFKQNIADIQNARDILLALRPVTYDFLQTGNAQYMHFSNTAQLGLIAQEVESVLPQVVSNINHPQQSDTAGNIMVPSFQYKTLNYEALIPVLIKGFQEQEAYLTNLEGLQNNNDSLQGIISDLNDRLTHLENCLSNILPALCNANDNPHQRTKEDTQDLRVIQLSDKNAWVLEKNIPNPFSDYTTIKYLIPETIKDAKIQFYNIEGKLIHSVEILERGSGELKVLANELNAGMYMYCLVLDGKIEASQKMIKE